MASREAIVRGLELCTMLCTNPPDITDAMVQAWVEALGDVADRAATVAFEQYLRQSQWWPAPADIRALALRVLAPDVGMHVIDPPGAVWALVVLSALLSERPDETLTSLAGQGYHLALIKRGLAAAGGLDHVRALYQKFLDDPSEEHAAAFRRAREAFCSAYQEEVRRNHQACLAVGVVVNTWDPIVVTGPYDCDDEDCNDDDDDW